MSRIDRQSSRLYGLALAAFFLLLYIGTVPRNRSEAEDAYLYAIQVASFPIGETVHSHHLVYIPLMKGVHWIVTTLGASPNAVKIMAMTSAVAASLVLLLLFMLFRDELELGLHPSLLGTGLLGFSYGFWRYAAEAEIYALALLPACAAIYAAASQQGGTRRAVICIALSVTAMLTHLLVAAAVLVGVPVIYAMLGRRRSACIVPAIVAGLVALIYAATPGLSFVIPSLQGWSSNLLAAPILGLIGFGQCLFAGTFLFGFESFRAWITSAMPHKVLREELFLGEQMGSRWSSISALLLVVLVCLSAYTVVVLWRHRAEWLAHLTEQAGGSVAKRRRAVSAGAIVWIAAHSMVALAIAPASPEVWLMGVVPCVILLTLVFIYPLCVTGSRRLACLLLAVLFAHNLVGGMAPILVKEWDYNHLRVEAVRDHVEPGDLIIAAGHHVFLRHLKYALPVRVYDLQENPYDRWAQDVTDHMAAGRRVRVLDDVFELHQSIRKHRPATYGRMEEFQKELLPACEVTHEGRFLKLYSIRADLNLSTEGSSGAN